MNDWWFQAFPQIPYQKPPPAADQMLILIAYDIADPKRLARVAKTCEDYGVRVQYSVFECQLEPDDFETLWLTLLDLINEKEDRLVAYKLDARCAKLTETAGIMTCAERVICYLV
jgi:CRISPR-associated protein Cas2